MKTAASVGLLLLVSLVLLLEANSGQIPAYHPAPPKKGEALPPILPKDQLWGPSFQRDFQVRAYEIAAKIPKVIYQQPCYCYCDRIGHTSLHTCYETTHAAHCAACLKELYLAYVQTKRGKTATQIRKAIIAGEWEKIDLETAALIK